MTHYKQYNQNGFTLVELTIVMIIMGIMSLTLAAFISNWLQTSGLDSTRTILLTNAQTALDTITNDIMLSGNVDQTNRWPDPNGPGGQFGWQSNSQTLILAKVATTSNGSPIFLDSADYITQKDDVIYYLSGTTLYRRTLASNSANDSAITTCPPDDASSTCPADTTIATGVTNWSVAYYGSSGALVSPSNATSIQLSITITGSFENQTISASYSTRMVFRNA